MAAAPAVSAARTVYQVSELAEIVGGLLGDSLPRLWVQGEISNFSRPASGHWYFTLKDARAQLRCVMFKGQNFHVRPQPADGDSVLVRGQLGLYAARGDLQLVCEHLEAAGQGALLRAFEQTKARLAAEGLFDAALKRPLPAAPRHIGLITSATGAAVQDILSTLARRFPLAQVSLLPVPVQGAEAAPAIVRALRELPQREPVQVILLARGGGSLEDLWAFNEEAVARAVRACAVPVVSGVGHEIDFTLADFAADLRAPTPTAAAELATPDLGEWAQTLESLHTRMSGSLHKHLHQLGQRAMQTAQRLHRLHPGRRLRDAAQRLDELSVRLNIGRRLQATAQQLQQLHLRMVRAGTLAQQQPQQRLARAQALLASLNPRAVLERGYAIVRDRNGRVLSDARSSASGDEIEILLARGAVHANVSRIQSDDPRDS